MNCVLEAKANNNNDCLKQFFVCYSLFDSRPKKALDPLLSPVTCDRLLKLKSRMFGFELTTVVGLLGLTIG